MFLEDHFQKCIFVSQEYFLSLAESKKNDYIVEKFLRTIDENLEHYERHIEYFVRFKDLYINTMFGVHK